MLHKAVMRLDCEPCPVCHEDEGGLLINNGDYSVCNECGHEDLCPACGGTGWVVDKLQSWKAWETVEVPCDAPDCPGEVV